MFLTLLLLFLHTKHKSTRSLSLLLTIFLSVTARLSAFSPQYYTYEYSSSSSSYNNKHIYTHYDFYQNDQTKKQGRYNCQQKSENDKVTSRDLKETNNILQHLIQGVGVTSIVQAPAVQIITTRGDDNHHDHDHNSQSFRFYIGTKRGTLSQIDISSIQNETHNHTTCNTSTCNLLSLSKPYPIYSMDVILNSDKGNTGDNGVEAILCGGGDRYVTIWNNHSLCMPPPTSANDTPVPPPSFQHQHTRQHTCQHTRQQLGPHTGWVKDVIYDQTNELIYSIGCNCIEIWSKDDTNSGDNHYDWIHQCKLMIDSCKETGATLSSDLLCLCLLGGAQNSMIDDDDHDNTGIDESSLICTKSILFAGGVDGRLHAWSIKNKCDKNKSKIGKSTTSLEVMTMGNIRAHDGRVNRLLVCDKMKLLVSIGNDGVIQCHDISDLDSLLGGDPTSNSVKVVHDVEGNLSLHYINRMEEGCDDQLPTDPMRLSSICCIYEDVHESIIAIGTSSGQVFSVEVKRHNTSNQCGDITKHDEGVNISIDIMKNIRLFDFDDDGNTGSNIGPRVSVHDLSCIEDSTFCAGFLSRYSIVIGHSNGLSLWKIIG